MNTQSVANNPAAQQQSQTPEIRSFELDDKAIGNIKSGVNYFRGNIQLPIDFLTLTGYKGLDIKVSAMYGSNIKNNLDTWNIEAPTGVLGLGWDMSFEFISVYKANSQNSGSDLFYLVSGGSANPLVKVGEQGGIWLFETRNYQFWKISYDPIDESWLIIKEDGTQYRYGGNQNACQYGVRWGNWIGSSVNASEQKQYCSAWNLISIESAWGHKVQYDYENVMHRVGQTGLEFTQASYLKTVTDSFGRKVEFNYQEKYGALNQSAQGIAEYQAENAQSPEPNAFQNKYETRYLDSLDVINADSEHLYTMKYTYDFINNASPSDIDYELRWKRVLKSVFQFTPDGTSLPGLHFDYNDGQAISPGTLKSVTYPTGGVARITYKELQINSPKRIAIDNPLPGSTPGVWHGDDYVVFTFCNKNSAGFKVFVQSWQGRWVEAELTSSDMAAITADPQSVQVEAHSSYILLSVRNQARSCDQIYVFMRDDKKFGEWNLSNDQPYLFYVQGDAGPSLITSGSEFFVAHNKGYTQQTYQVRSFHWQTGQWQTPNTLPITGGDTGYVAALQNYYVNCNYTHSTQSLSFEIVFRDLEGNWQPKQQWKTSGIEVVENAGKYLFSLIATPTGVALTYISKVDDATISYTVTLYDWDEHFQILNPAGSVSQDLVTPVENGKALYDILQTITDGTFVNNNIVNLRKVGTGANSTWLSKQFLNPNNTTEFSVAAAQDTFVMSSSDGTINTNQLLTFNPNIPDNSAWEKKDITQAGTLPTVQANVLTMGARVYMRDVNGQWQSQANEIMTTAESTIQNRGPNFIAYQNNLNADANSYLITTNNGQISNSIEMPGGSQKITVPEHNGVPLVGSNLVGPRFIVSYTSAEFDAADQLFLLNVDDKSLSDNIVIHPVAYIEIEDAHDNEASFYQSYFYANSNESQISYNSKIGLAQFPIVIEVAGVKSTNNTPPETPEGRTERYFSNGLSGHAGLYPQATWTYNYANILNGMLLAKKEFDSANRLVRSKLNYWEIINNSDGKRLYGAYVRLRQTNSVLDGVRTNNYVTYDDTTGLPVNHEQEYYANDGTRKLMRTHTKYAWQEPKYQSLFLSAHILNTVIEETTSVVNSEASTSNFTKSTITTYKNWSDNPNKIKLAAHQKYVWTAPGASAPIFDYSSGKENENWLLLSEVTKRGQIGGAIHEQLNVDGIPTSFIYDENERYNIAKFPGAAISQQEASYYGFESYEKSGMWQLGSNSTIIPSVGNTVIDAHTGVNSLQLAPNTQDNSGITATFIPQLTDLKFIFSAWVKKPADFKNNQGDAVWCIELSSGDYVQLDFPETTGEWLYIHQTFDVTNANTSISITCKNKNTQAPVYIDNLRFSPLDSTYTASVYNSKNWTVIAELAANGETQQSTYNELEQGSLSTNAGDVMTAVKSRYYSSQGNQGQYSTQSPNHDLAIQAAEGGTLCNFKRGAQWQNSWQPSPDVWQVEAGRLSQKAHNQPGTLTLLNAPNNNRYALAVRFETGEALDGTLGIQLDDNTKIQWNPSLFNWQLIQSDSTELASDQSIFSVPSMPYLNELNQGEISNNLLNEFAKSDYPLSQDASVVTGPVDQTSWTLNSENTRYLYQLNQNGDSIEVYRPQTNWDLIIDDKTLLFWANGQLIFSCQLAHVLNSAPQLFFNNKVIISEIAHLISPQAQVKYKDSRGVLIQEQSLDDKQVVAHQKVTDNLGRAAVTSKSVFVKNSENPLFKYGSNLASLNWHTGKMTGLVDTANPADGGYSYTREVYETSPLARVNKIGNPGAKFQVDAHPSVYQYTNVDNKFYKLVSTDPNQNVYYEIKNQRDQLLSKVSINGEGQNKSTTLFDDAGNAIKIQSPNYFSPPTGSVPEDWVITQAFDFNGNMISSTQHQQTTNYVYDKSGRIRFVQDQQGQQSGNYNYVKYNRVGRDIEKGYVVGSWDHTALQAHSDVSPNWPATPNTWRQKLCYDDASVNAIGRAYKTESNNGIAGQTDVNETFSFDVFGNTTLRTLSVADFDGNQQQSVQYTFDNLGNTAKTIYPDGTADGYAIYFNTNRQNLVSAISDSPSFDSQIAGFSYLANGQVYREQVITEAGLQIIRELNYNSPEWLKEINQTLAGANKPLFEQTLSYSEGGYEGAAYFDGTIASSTTAINDKPTSQFKYAVDDVGGITDANSELSPEHTLKINGSRGYDNNGNIKNVTFGSSDYVYKYISGTQQVQSITNSTSNNTVLADYAYDLNGNATTAKFNTHLSLQPHELGLDYDPGSKMTTQITDTGGPESNTLHFAYGRGNQRVLKTVQGASGEYQQKLYVRDLNGKPLTEFTKISSQQHDVATSSMIYFYGPTGLIAFRKGNKNYSVGKDHLGSVRTVFDENAQIIAQYDYLTFGALSKAIEPEPGFLPYLFTGQEFDREIGMYNFGARFYHAELGRFIATDPDKQYFSPYIYASNNPVLYIDPTGRFSISSLFSAIAGAIIGAVEILVGVVIDVVAGVLEVITGGLSTPASAALAAAAGAFYGAGVSAITYSVFNATDFNWKEYGVDMGIGAAAGFITGGLSVFAGEAAGSIAASASKGVKASTSELSNAGKVLNGAKKGVVWLGETVADTRAAPGIKGYLTDATKAIAKSEAIGITKNTAMNLASGNDWDSGLGQTVFSAALSGAVSGGKVKSRVSGNYSE
ncbi:RHS repeat-associated core domain-containing protein [Pseudoalteromonas sp. 20-92]|uniref:RHS repeat domain-containing protein n=1 Tax=Pseudoalteromonas sp. 20-92 TaxID=2969394 RepID=UPI0027ADBE90|nr:RHS repeat-associated core domain-containing protein [Pseudoalteromonas sp. 20-92]MDQ2046066.1 RHS repeat-associated core domain-containing protein [Pseudoalteromonas sp. 20-92]